VSACFWEAISTPDGDHQIPKLAYKSCHECESTWYVEPPESSMEICLFYVCDLFFFMCNWLLQCTASWLTWHDRCCGTVSMICRRYDSAVIVTVSPMRRQTSTGSVSHAAHHISLCMPSRRVSPTGLLRWAWCSKCAYSMGVVVLQ
jgi:hypothetical protein